MSYLLPVCGGMGCSQSQWVQPHSISDTSCTLPTSFPRLPLPNYNKMKMSIHFLELLASSWSFYTFIYGTLWSWDSLHQNPCSREFGTEISELLLAGAFSWGHRTLWKSRHSCDLGIAGPYWLDISFSWERQELFRINFSVMLTIEQGNSLLWGAVLCFEEHSVDP